MTGLSRTPVLSTDVRRRGSWTSNQASPAIAHILRSARQRSRRELEKFLQERLESEVRKSTSKEHRRELACEELAVIERMPCFIEQRDVMLKLLMRIAAQQLA